MASTSDLRIHQFYLIYTNDSIDTNKMFVHIWSRPVSVMCRQSFSLHKEKRIKIPSSKLWSWSLNMILKWTKIRYRTKTDVILFIRSLSSWLSVQWEVFIICIGICRLNSYISLLHFKVLSLRLATGSFCRSLTSCRILGSLVMTVTSLCHLSYYSWVTLL